MYVSYPDDSPDTAGANPFGEDTDIVKMNRGRDPRILINPAGPTDPEVSVLYLENAQGKPLSVFANYSLHYVGNTGGEMSADYFGEFARLMPIRMRGSAEGFVAMMSNGTSGDINNINFTNPHPPREPFEQIRVVATKTADAAYRAVRRIETKDADPVLGMKQRVVALKHRAPTEEQLERARNIVKVDAEGEKKLPRLANAYAQQNAVERSF